MLKGRIMRIRFAWMLCLASCVDPAPKTKTKTGSEASTESTASQPAKPPPPRVDNATRLCATIHTLPRDRRAECCASKRTFSLQPECERRLKAALRARQVRLSTAAVDRCAAAMAKAFDGCDWVGPHWLPLPRGCLDVVQGRLREHQPCRSHLVCPKDHYCAGMTTDLPGTCQKSRAVGEACNFGPDELATVLQQDNIEESHSPCAGGYCRLGKCAAFSPVGQPCGAKGGCGPNARCSEGLCVAGALAKAGQTCTLATCVDGLRCVEGRCQKPKPPQAACTSDEACFGVCKDGKCQRDCTSHPRFQRFSRP